MSEAIGGLAPQRLWHYFAEICRIPHGSGNEKAIADFIVSTAMKLGLEHERDACSNIVVRKPACGRRGHSQMTCLQAHMDMVQEKNRDTSHDFMKDPIELIKEGDYIRANGTTLGADNGIGVAANLAIMEDSTIVHGPLEFLFTTGEETGLAGAIKLAPSFIRSRILINLDAEEEGSIFIGCSGGAVSSAAWEAEYENIIQDHVPFGISVRGLKGGHSGLDIDKWRGNSIKILNRILLGLEKLDIRLFSIAGGNKSNAIPREAEAVVFIPARNLAALEIIMIQLSGKIRAELSLSEPDLVISAESVKSGMEMKAIGKKLQETIFCAISALPHGILKMSQEIPELVETSSNLGVIRTEDGKITITVNQRSSIRSELLDAQKSALSVFHLAGAKYQAGEGYPGWKPDLNSKILDITRKSYARIFSSEPQIKAIHAGLECGIIGEKYPGVDMIALGPTLKNVHSPDERVKISSVEKFYSLILEVLKVQSRIS